MGIKKAIKDAVIRIIPDSLKYEVISQDNHRRGYPKFINLSFSQEGEDLVLRRLMEHRVNGFYVDVGAHHPFRFSNTFKFYLSGWRGINIDPLPESMKRFQQHRPNDINLEIPILSNPDKEMVYYMFDEPALNSFNADAAREIAKNTTFKIIDTISIKPWRLDQVFDKYLPKDTKIDFLSIDVEAMDLEVLQSNNWSRYRPDFIIAESISTTLANDINSPISKFLREQKYGLIAKTVNSLFYSKTIE